LLSSLSPLNETYEPPREPQKPEDPRDIWKAILEEEPIRGDHWSADPGVALDDEFDSDGFDDEDDLPERRYGNGSESLAETSTTLVNMGLITPPAERDEVSCGTLE
jgi:hypothetical protein